MPMAQEIILSLEITRVRDVLTSSYSKLEEVRK
jgi:hypothetical protein